MPAEKTSLFDEILSPISSFTTYGERYPGVPHVFMY